MKIMIYWPDDAPLPTAVRVIRERTTKKQVELAKRMYLEQHTLDDIAKKLKCSKTTIKHIVRKHVPPEFRRTQGWQHDARRTRTVTMEQCT